MCESKSILLVLSAVPALVPGEYSWFLLVLAYILTVDGRRRSPPLTIGSRPHYHLFVYRLLVLSTPPALQLF